MRNCPNSTCVTLREEPTRTDPSTEWSAEIVALRGTLQKISGSLINVKSHFVIAGPQRRRYSPATRCSGNWAHLWKSHSFKAIQRRKGVRLASIRSLQIHGPSTESNAHSRFYSFSSSLIRWLLGRLNIILTEDITGITLAYDIGMIIL